MKLLQFLAEKVVIVEVMLIILNVSMLYFGLSLPLLATFLVFLTHIAVISLILYIILALLKVKHALFISFEKFYKKISSQLQGTRM